jgi:hypothetical protein
MKKTIIFLILLILIPTLCFAGALQEKQRQVIAKKNTAGGAKTIAHVARDAYGHNTEASSTIATGAAKAAATGNTIVVFVFSNIGGYQHAPISITGITDTAGNTYTKITTGNNAEGYNEQVEMWYATNITGNASNIVTATFSESVSNSTIQTMEFSGLGTASVDTYNHSTGTNAPSSCSITTTEAVTLAFSGLRNTQQASNGSAGSGYTMTSEVVWPQIFEYKINSTSGTYSGDFTGFSDGTWLSIQAALK